MPLPVLPASLQALADRAREIAKDGALAPNSALAYQSRLRAFDAWATSQIPHFDPVEHVTPEVIAAWLVHYLVDQGRKISSASLTLAALRHRSLSAATDSYCPCDHPLVLRTIDALRRGLPSVQVSAKKARPLTTDEIKAMVAAIDGVKTTTGCHGLKVAFWKAYVLLAFVSGMRREEMVRLQTSWLTFDNKGLIVRLPSSKTDQAKKGQTLRIPNGSTGLCAVTATREWLAARAEWCGSTGSVFPSGVSLTRVLKRDDIAAFNGEVRDQADLRKLRSCCNKPTAALSRLALAAELPIDASQRLSHHSTRRGVATELRRVGTDVAAISTVLRHGSLDSTMGYVDVVDSFDSHPAAGLDL